VLDVDILKRNLNVLLAEVHVRSESGGGLPLARSAGCSLLQHLVDLLEGKTLGLGNEEVGEEDW
jgi:inactivated superfamily I helicase